MPLKGGKCIGVLSEIAADRSSAKVSFNLNRVRAIQEDLQHLQRCNGVVYWMSRDQRLQDNWALLWAQKLALERGKSLHVAFCLVPSFLNATLRQYDFMLKGLEEVSEECQRLDIHFHLLQGEAKTVLPGKMTMTTD